MCGEAVSSTRCSLGARLETVGFGSERELPRCAQVFPPAIKKRAAGGSPRVPVRVRRTSYGPSRVTTLSRASTMPVFFDVFDTLV
jgi:hypothetical protein